MSSSPSFSPPPADDGLRCEIASRDQTATVHAVGELDFASAPTLQAACAEARRNGMRHVIVDLRGLGFIDSSGLRCILDLHTESRLDGFSLALIPGPHAVQRIFELTGTLTLLPFIEP